MTALAAGLALTVGAAAPGQAAPGRAQDQPSCDTPAARGTSTPAAPAQPPEAAPAPAPAGTAAQKISYSVDSQLPIGLWSSSAVTLRTPVTKGKIRLDVSSRGFSTDSLTVQRYDTATRRWVDLDSAPGGGSSWPTRATLTFPVSAKGADAKHPHTVALRLQDLDRPGTLTVAASVEDGRGHTYRAPARTTTATRPKVTVSRWQHGTALTRGGSARTVTVTVKNTTNRAYPALGASYFAYGVGKTRALEPKDLTLRQHRSGRGWERVALVAGGCDPGMSAALRPVAVSPLAPGATAVYRLKVAVARTAPRDVDRADAGVTVSNGDMSFFSKDLPFTIRGGKRT
ncbi:hypothetical protein [Streptomyces sp. NPDC046261]|uniref:hypothetical protein n=1 Tax=Streptomyces sp. NPDC046261 TaxID=3157200 RepID=UPI003400F2BE